MTPDQRQLINRTLMLDKNNNAIRNQYVVNRWKGVTNKLDEMVRQGWMIRFELECGERTYQVTYEGAKAAGVLHLVSKEVLG